MAGCECEWFYALLVVQGQGRNFGPKSGGTNSEEGRGTFGSRGETEENGEEVFCYSPDPWGLGERLELSE